MTPEVAQACHDYATRIVADLPPITDEMAEQAAYILATASANSSE